MTSLAGAFALVADPQVMGAMIVGLLVGMIFGVIPGITSTIAMATVLPLLFYVQPIVAIALLTALYTGGIAGGGISAILLGMPGQPSSIATTIDGFKMTRQGKHNTALGLSIYSSAFGTAVSYIGLLVLLVPLTQILQYLGPPDRAAITLAALLLVAAVVAKDFIRGLIAILVGIVLGTLSPTEGGLLRSSFLGLPMLYDGVPLLPAVTGLVAFSELLDHIREHAIVKSDRIPERSARRILGAFRTWLTHWPIVSVSSGIGFIIGALPGAGATIAGLAAYGQVRAWSKHRARFGQGEPRGVTASETANNASEGGAMLTLLALGIPGSANAAIVLGAFLLFGLQPGPLWITQNLPFAYAVVLVNVLSALVYIPLAAILFSRAAAIIQLPIRYLAPALVVIASVGIYSTRASLFDVGLLWVFAFAGLFLGRYGYPTVGVLLGVILGPEIDSELYRVTVLYSDDPLGAILRPTVLLSIVLVVAAVAGSSGLLRRTQVAELPVTAD